VISERPGGLPAGESVLADYYRAWFRYHPEAAVEVGAPGYAGLLTPYGDDERGALVHLNDALLVALEELDGGAPGPDQSLDLDLVRNAARLENKRLIELEARQTDPGRPLPVNAIYQLLVRTVEDFPAALAARLQAVPAHLEGARDWLRPRAHRVPPLWLESAVLGARHGAEFVRELPDHPKVRAAALSGLEALTQAAVRALGEYADFLEREIAVAARGEFACGRDYFEELLARHHYLDVGSAELRAFGERLFERTAAELRAVCRELAGDEDAQTLARRLRADHPAAAELLGAYREAMQAAHAFLARHDLVALPEPAALEVVETPLFLRHQIPFAAYHEPEPADPRQQGYYYVTPPQDEAELGEHDRIGLRHTCVHEAWPGHHLQFVTANLHPVARSLPRLLNPSATLYEGWALYCEQLMQEQGFLDRPQSRFILLKDRLWRALRIVLDVDLHTGGLAIADAAERMVRALGFPRSQALAELRWYSQSPTVPMGYATGWALIGALRERLRASEPGFTLRKFHDRLLSQGSIALALAIRRAFGEPAWRAARETVFGPHPP
jgi:uncharacterized protein (DUF885 family)